MTFKKTEKEIIKAIVKYGDEKNSMAQVINKSQLLEKRGIVIAFGAHGTNCSYVFYNKDKYDYDDNKALGYISEMLSLIHVLIMNRLITLIPVNARGADVIGRRKYKLSRPGWIELEDAMIDVDSNKGNWFDHNQQQTYWPNRYSEQDLPTSQLLDCWFTVSQELKDLVKNDFKTEDQIRFEKQQRLTWISIAVTGFIGFAGLVIAIIGIFIR
jgi:hypothetical protein